jgi:hypothetical protein
MGVPMIGRIVCRRLRTVLQAVALCGLTPVFVLCAAGCAAAAWGGGVAAAQALTVDTNGKGGIVSNGSIDRQYAQIVPTHVDLPKAGINPKTRMLLIRAIQSEQGFAMRPFPRGHKGLTLAANGNLDPAGQGYLNMVIEQGLSAKPGSRVVITDIKVEHAKIILALNGGPDAKHRFLRHIQIGVGTPMGTPNVDPDIASQAGNPVGARLTLTFAGQVPDLTAEQLKSLLAPLISFDVKSPIQAYTDTLPPELKQEILNHKVLVGMSIDMVLYAMGQPLSKSREMDGQMPFEEWVYGTPPQDVNFVRINGNRVIRVAVAKDGKPMQIFTTDVVSPMLLAGGNPAQAAPQHVRIIREGDVEDDPDKRAPKAAPSLRNPGETLPNDRGNDVMRPVQPPRPHTDEQLGVNPDEQPSTSPDASQPAPSSTGAPAQKPAPAATAQPN